MAIPAEDEVKRVICATMEETRMRSIMLTGAALMLSSGMAFADQCGSLQASAAGNHPLRLAQNDTGSGNGTVGARPGGVNVPAAVGVTSGTAGASSGQMTHKGTTGTDTATGATQSSKVSVPPTVGKSGGAGGGQNGSSSNSNQ